MMLLDLPRNTSHPRWLIKFDSRSNRRPTGTRCIPFPHATTDSVLIIAFKADAQCARRAAYAARHRPPLCKLPLKSNPNRALGGRSFNFVTAVGRRCKERKKERWPTHRLIEVSALGNLIFDIRCLTIWIGSCFRPLDDPDGTNRSVEAGDTEI